MNKQIIPPTEEEKQNINKFIKSGYFEITQQGDYFFFGVKRGYLKQLKADYTLKKIKVLLNRTEELLNYGSICPECLSFCKYISEEETNAHYFKCLNCEVKQ